METLPIVLKKGQPFLGTLSDSSSLKRAICPREKFISFIDESGNLIIHLLSDDLQTAQVDNDKFIRYQWVASSKPQQDCIVDHKLEHKSELLAVTTTFDCHWYSVRNDNQKGQERGQEEHEDGGQTLEQQQELGGQVESIKVELLAVLKRVDLCAKLRKIDFPDVLESVIFLGSDEGNVLLLFNCSLVCHLVLDQEYACIALLGCYTLQLSLQQYQDDQLPEAPGALISCIYVSPLLFALTADGIVFVYGAIDGSCRAIISVMDYSHYYCGRTPDWEMSNPGYKLLSVSPDLSHLSVSLTTKHLLLINLPEYFQIFPHHYHPHFTAGLAKHLQTSKVAASSHSDISTEEEEERRRYGGLSPQQHKEKYVGSFAGNYPWLCRLDNLENAVNEFSPKNMKYLNLYQSSQLPGHGFSRSRRLGAGDGHAPSLPCPARKEWHEEPQSSLSGSGKVVYDCTFVTGVKKGATESLKRKARLDGESRKQCYSNHCFLPAATQEDLELVRVDLAPGTVTVYYGLRAEARGVDMLSEVDVPAIAMATYCTDSQSYSYTRLPQACWLVQTSNTDQLVYLVNEQFLAVNAFNLSQEEFVGKVLMFGSASMAEEVCHLNRWDQCSLPINALETALELRQLDTLAFFLRSRDTDTSEEDQGQDNDMPPLPPLPPDQLDIAIERLIGAIDRNCKEEHHCQFASQLLIMTLGFVTRMIKNEVLREELKLTKSEGHDNSTSGQILEDDHVTSDTLNKLTLYIQQLRTFLPEAPSLVSRKGGEEDGVTQHKDNEDYVTTFMDKALVSDWDRVNPKDLLKEALLRGCLPLAQAYLLHKKPEDFNRQRLTPRGYGTTQQVSIAEALDDYPPGQKPFSSRVSYHSDVSLRCVQITAIGYMIQALEKRNIKLANSILMNIGLDVHSSLRHVCFNTLDVELRNFLSKELMIQKQMSEAEVAALEYLHILEGYYPVQSYDNAHAHHSKSLQAHDGPHSRQTSGKMAFQATALPVIPGIMNRTTAIPSLGNLQDLYPEMFGGDHPLSWEPPLLSPTSHATLYLQVPLAAVVCWDDATKQRLLFESFVLNGQTEGPECERIMQKRHIFDYYISHNDKTSAVRYVMSSVPPIENTAPCPAFIISLCSSTLHSTSHLYNTLLDELARNGVFLPSELDDFPAFLHRLGRVHTLFTLPHPLSKVACQKQSDEDYYSLAYKENAVVSTESFHRKFLNYLVENRFYSLMYHYLDSYELGLDESSITLLGLDDNKPWVHVLLQYRLAALNPHDLKIIFQASLSCGHFLLTSDLVLHKPSVMEMLQNGRILMAMATLMYAPVPLKDAISEVNSDQPWYAESASVHQAITAYPSLQAAIFPSSPTSFTPAQSQDITLYELLQDDVVFDIGRLFKWQETNILSPGHDEADINTFDLPHFSSPALAEKFALSEHLDYVYYLHKGQPSFAFANFVAAKLLGRSNTGKRIDRLIKKVYGIALHDFANSHLGASCAALMEMLGRDSTAFRIDLQCANRIAKFTDGLQQGDMPVSSKKDNGYKNLVLQFCYLFKSHNNSAATSLLTQLELATKTMITNSGVEICGLEAEECWELVQSFCQCHQLLPSLAFLAVCAENGQWLQLLCNAQLYCISPQKVLVIVEKHFNNTCIKEHLTLAISSMGTSTSPLPAKGNEGGEKSKSRKRRVGTASKNAVAERANFATTQPDLRVKFYSRVGLQREGTPQSEAKTFQGDQVEGKEELTKTATKGQNPVSSAHAASPPPQVDLPPALLENELPTDLFSAIFRSQNKDSMWRALLAHAVALQRPLLAVLAACYQDSCVLDCTCAWLFSLLGSTLFDKWTTLLAINGETSMSDGQLQYHAEIQWRRWSTLDLSLMLISAMQHSPNPAAQFSLAIHYFDGNSPLFSFLKFHEEFVLRNNYEESKKYLHDFQLSLDKCKTYGFVGVIGDIQWVEQVASSMASHMLVLCPTPFERSHLLQLLSETQFGENFKCSVLNFSNLYQMSCVLSEADLSSDAAFTIKEHFSTVPGLKSLNELYSVRVRVDTDYVLGLLLERGQFNIARKYASIVDTTTSQITIKEAEYNLNLLRKSTYWEYEGARLNFWHQCNSDFHKANVESEAAADFFHLLVPHGEEFDSNGAAITAMEKSLLLAFALKWRQQSDRLNTEQIQDLEKKIWLSHIHSAMDKIENSTKPRYHDSPLPFLTEVDHSTASLFSQPGYTSLLSSLSITAQQHYKSRRHLTEFILPDNVSVALEGKSRTCLTRKEGEAFDMMLGRLMNAGLLSQARLLAGMFEHDSPDLTIVLCCIQLCQGKLTTSQLTDDVLSLVSARPPRHLSDTSTSLIQDLNHSQASEIIRMLNTLSDRATYAQQCCSCIITCFRIALVLKLSYASVINTEPFETLTQLLGSGASERFLLASKFITTCNLDPKVVAGFLSECIATSLQAKYGGPGNPSDSPKSRVYRHQMSSSQFHELAQLSSDPTLLGNLLLTMAKTLVSQDSESNQTIQVELLIRSHDCYTLGCSVDGISDVLVVAQNWVQKLVNGKHFKLMVRLLTGISRYHEMGYIIGLLIEHDQFESLVNKGVEKEEQLRVALIEYLRQHGSDNEKLQMVALNFGMPRELAKAMEDQAKRELAQIQPKHLASNNNETVRKLKKIFDGFRDSAKTYAKEDCLNSAEHCLSQARLVALQLSVLNQNKQVINLEPKVVLKYMEELPFTEALIVSDAYRQCIWADWVNPVYKRVILGGDFRYLNEYKIAFPLTPTIFTELAGKFQRDKEKTSEAFNNMRKLLADLKHLPLKQKLTSQLGLNEVMPSKYDASYMSDIQRL